jgi:hypothetical protein
MRKMPGRKIYLDWLQQYAIIRSYLYKLYTLGGKSNGTHFYRCSKSSDIDRLRSEALTRFLHKLVGLPKGDGLEPDPRFA